MFYRHIILFNVIIMSIKNPRWPPLQVIFNIGYRKIKKFILKQYTTYHIENLVNFASEIHLTPNREKFQHRENVFKSALKLLFHLKSNLTFPSTF